MTKKLLFVVNVDWFFASHRLPIAIAAVREGYEVHIACDIIDKKDYFENLGIIVHPLTISRSGTGVSKELFSFWNIFKVMKNIKPDIIHFVTIKPVLYGGLAARLLNVKNKVFAISGLGHVFGSNNSRQSFMRFSIIQLYKIALGSETSKVIVQNSDDRNILMKMNAIKKEQTILIRGSGVNLDSYSYEKEINSTPPVVVLAARLLKDKGIFEFVESAKIIHNNGISAKFKLYGNIDTGNPTSLTLNDLNKIEKEKIVDVCGHTNNISEVFKNSHIVVLPSYYREGLPKVLIEAAACGRAVITTNLPGCRDAIEENVTGLFVREKDSKSLANAIEKLLANHELRKQMGKAGRKFAEEEFDIQTVIDRHLKIYQSFYEDVNQ